jgi:hypothetical protein
MKLIIYSEIAICLILVLSACTRAGAEYQSCLEDGTCLGPDLGCNKEQNICYKCGSVYMPCCSGNSCDIFLTCVNGECVGCGGESGNCCPGETCQTPGELLCDSGICRRCGNYAELTCPGNKCNDPEMIVVEGRCTNCGMPGSPPCSGNICMHPDFLIIDQVCRGDCGQDDGDQCCAGNICREFLICGTDNTCHSCGGYLGSIPCQDNKCRGWLVPSDGVCTNPFEPNPGTDVSTCLSAEPGSDPYQRDWCYWYAAYYKNDTSLCTSIEWGEMRGYCQAGENPGNYLIGPYGTGGVGGLH